MMNEAFLRRVAPGARPDRSAEVTVYSIGWALMPCTSRPVRETAQMLGEQSDSSIRFQMSISYAAIPAGVTLTGSRYAMRLVQILRDGRA